METIKKVLMEVSMKMRDIETVVSNSTVIITNKLHVWDDEDWTGLTYSNITKIEVDKYNDMRLWTESGDLARVNLDYVESYQVT